MTICYGMPKRRKASSNATSKDIQRSSHLKQVAYDEIMSKIGHEIQEMTSKGDRKLFKEIVQFAKDSYRPLEGDDTLEQKTPLHFLWDLGHHAIPTAVVRHSLSLSPSFLHPPHPLSLRLCPVKTYPTILYISSIYRKNCKKPLPL